MTETLVNAGGTSLACVEAGNAIDPAIVLARGLGSQLIDWPDNLVEGLVDAGLRVIMFDNRDSGLSQKFPDGADYTIFDMAGDVVALMDALGIERAHLLGISMGGMIGQVVAANYGERLLSFVSVMSSSSRAGLPGPTPAALEALTAETPAGATREEIIAAAVTGEKIWSSPGYPIPDDELTTIMARRYDRCYCPDGVSRQMAAVVAAGDRSAMLRSISVPTLVIHGEDDTLIPIDAGRDTAELIPGAVFVAVPGMGHNLPASLMPRFLAIVLDFLKP